MAEKPKTDAKTKVTRIKATDNTAKTPKVAKAPKERVVKADVASVTPDATAKKGVLARIGGYFKGAWIELKQVRWPTRRATWGLTIAVILFSLFFVLVILLLDTLFQQLFQLIIA